MQHTLRITWLATVGLLAGACADQTVTAPTPAATDAPSLSAAAGGGRPQLISNAVKYRDEGSKPATGRSGSATLTVRALLAKDGSTLVEATTGALDGGAAPGQIVKVQAKVAREAGVTTLNYNGLAGNGYWSQSYPELKHNDQVQIQANIRGIDPKRTGVVTVDNAVKLRPDLRAAGLAAPASVHTNSVVHISATIAEHNQDVGAFADCVLSVDGEPVADAQRVWVDAGDAVTCAFITTFATPGTKQIAVSASNVAPADWDTADNTVTGSIEVVVPEVRVAWQSNFWADDRDFDIHYNDWYYGGWGRTGFWKRRQVWMNGYTADETPLGTDPIAFSSVLTSDGITVGTSSATSYDSPWYGYDCRSAFDPQTNTHYSLCQYPSNAGSPYHTQLHANNYSTRAVYYSWDYYWGYYGYTYNENAGFSDYAIGSAIGFDVRATNGSGMIWRAETTTPVASSPYQSNCGWYYYSCSGWESGTSYSGFATGN